MNLINEQIVKIANGYIGQKELKNNSGFEDKTFWLKMEAVGFDKGEAWCALFSELVWREAYGLYDSTFDHELEKLFSDSAVQTFNNFKKAGWKVTKEPVPGSLVIWQMYKDGKPHWSGHAGIVDIKDTMMPNHFNTIEGNTNAKGGREGDQVTKKVRVLDFDKRNYGLVLLGFIYPKS